MLHFKPVTVSDKELFEKYTYRCGEKNCDLAFANVYCWSSFFRTEICEYGGFLVSRFRIDGGDKIGYAEPLGDGDMEAVIAEISADARRQGQPLRMQSLSPEFIEKISGLNCINDLFVYSNRDYYDYIYSVESLRTLSGKKLQPKRNHVNQFRRQYEYRYEPLTEGHKEEVFALLHKWQEAKHTDIDKFLVEDAVIRCGMQNFNRLGLIGGALYVGGRMVAFTYGSAINDDTFCVHIEKADTDFESSFPMINQLFINTLPEKYLYINREEDMGLAGLRDSKLSYHPLELYKKYYLFNKDSREMQIWTLLEQGFGADASLIAAYLMLFYDEKCVNLHYEDGEPAASLFAHYFRDEYGDIRYVSGLTVLPSFRGTGLGFKVLRNTLSGLYREGEALAFSVISGSRFANLAKCFGFAPSGTVIEEIKVPAALDFAGGMAGADSVVYRIINVEKYLRRYLLCFPETEASFRLYDDVIPENTGEYSVSGGKVTFVPSTVDEGMNPYMLFGKYPLAGSEFGFIR